MNLLGWEEFGRGEGMVGLSGGRRDEREGGVGMRGGLGARKLV